MKKAAFFLAFFAILLAVAFLPFWDKVYAVFTSKGRQGNFAQLNFTSVKGNYSVSLDDKLLGKIEESKTEEFVKIEPGIHKIKISRESESGNFYYVLERSIDFLPSTAVEITWEAGPTLESSSGVIRYFSQIVNPNSSELFILTFPNNANVEFDSKPVSNTTFVISDTSTHTVRVSNGKGFESKTIDVNLTNENTKSVLTNLKLVLEIYLYKEPFK